MDNIIPENKISIITENMDVEFIEKRDLKGKEIVMLIDTWLEKNRIHPDDFDMLFANELLARLEEDE